MISARYFFDKIQDVKLKDYLSVFPMIVARVLCPLYKKVYENAWLICETPEEARDNGYCFFKYINQYQPQQKCFYAIKKKSVDYKKIETLGNIIEYGSIQHWLAYFLCQYNISSQKGGKPNAALCSFMELNGCFKTKNIFLQHGVIINDLKWLYSDKTKLDLFVTSSKREQTFIINNFGYPREKVCLTGIPRFDNLHNIKINRKQILIMPTWRYWFNLKSKRHEDTDLQFETSEYYFRWHELLTCKEMGDLIEKYSLDIIFYPHRNMQKYIRLFDGNSKIMIADWKQNDIQALLINSAILITDYSSVFFDMVYMKKPVIFYKFDEDKYRKYQYSKGYFDYHNNPFGKTFNNYKDVLKNLEEYIKNEFKVSDTYLISHKQFFDYYDSNNSKRIYELLKNRR